jgi:hypothetical protein
MDQRLNRKILLASIVELQETIAWEFWHGSADTCEVLLITQRERLQRVDNTGHRDSGIAEIDNGSGESTTGDL